MDSGFAAGGVSNTISKKDIRRYERIPVCDYAMFHLKESDDSHRALVTDVSLGGLQMRTRQSITSGSMIVISIGQAGKPPVEIDAEVRHCDDLKSGELFTLGVRFFPATMEQRVAVVEYVHAAFRMSAEITPEIVEQATI